MPRYSWAVIYDGSTNIDDVQSISITKGRSQITDPFKGGTAGIMGRNVSGLPVLEIGKEIEIVATEGTNDFTMFHGVIADVQISYGTIEALDTYQISCEDSLAIAGRGLTGDLFSWPSGFTAYTAAEEVLYDAFLSALTLTGDPNGSFVSAQSAPNANVLQLLNKLANTEQGYLFALDPFTIQWVARNEYPTQAPLGDFTDDTLITINQEAPFQNVTFRSYADSYFDQVTVEADGLAPRSAGAGNRVYTTKTFDATLGQAKNLADYLLATLQIQESVPSTLSTIAEIQFNNVAIEAAQTAGSGRRAGLILRGDSYTMFIEGSTVTATPEQTRISLNLVSSEALSFFILDNAAFGRLDSDRLGF